MLLLLLYQYFYCITVDLTISSTTTNFAVSSTIVVMTIATIIAISITSINAATVVTPGVSTALGYTSTTNIL